MLEMVEFRRDTLSPEDELEAAIAASLLRAIANRRPPQELTSKFLAEKVKAALANARRVGSIDTTGIVDLLSGQDRDPLTSQLITREFAFGTGFVRNIRTGQPIDLTAIEYKIAFCLASNANLIVPHDRIIDFVWGYDSDSTSDLIKSHLTNMRRKFDHPGVVIDGKAAKSHFKAVPRFGYKMVFCD